MREQISSDGVEVEVKVALIIVAHTGIGGTCSRVGGGIDMSCGGSIHIA